MTTSEDELNRPVWYVAYGSNLLRRRFLSYLVGGHGPDGSGHHHGARDRAEPMADRPVEIDRRLVFVGRSRRWNGAGVCAVVGPDGDGTGGRSTAVGGSTPDVGPMDVPSTALGRAWLITVGQLLDVWRQENGGTISDDLPNPLVDSQGPIDHTDGRYRRLDRLEPIDGTAAFTVTCGPELAAETNPPAEAYLDVVRTGLEETWGLSSGAAHHYLWRHLP